MKRVKTTGFSAGFYVKRKLPQSGVAYAGVRGERADVALIQEFGTAKIPERSFIRSTFDASVKEIEKDILSHRVLTAANNLAERIVVTIDSNVPPPLAASTVKRKGHDHALIDTRQMRSEVGAFEEATE